MIRLSRRLVALVVGTLVASLILLVPQTAANAATTKYGAVSRFTSDSTFLNSSPVDVMPDCTGDAFYVATQTATGTDYSLKYTAKCGYAWTMIGLGGSEMTQTIKGVNTDGNACTRSGGKTKANKTAFGFTQSDTIPLGSVKNVAADPNDPTTIPGAITDLLSLKAFCQPTRMEHKGPFGAGISWAANLSLGAMPTFGGAGAGTPTSTCTEGTPVKVQPTIVVTNPSGGWYDGYYRIDWTVTFSPGAKGEWMGAEGVAPASSTTGLPTAFPPSEGFLPKRVGTGPNGSVSMVFTSGERVYNTGTQRPENKIPMVTPLAFQLVQKTKGYYNSGGFGGQNAWSSGVGLFQLGNGGQVTVGPGITYDKACVFYFGPKITDRPGDTYDEPFGVSGDPVDPSTIEPTPVVADPVPAPPPSAPEPACNFKISDPSTWATGSLCAVVGLLGKLVDTLVSIAKTIVSLPAELIRLFLELFVPDQAVMDGIASNVQDQWGQSSVGTMFTDLGSVFSAFNMPSGGSCQGPKWDFKVGNFSDTIYPLNACSGPTATAATLLRAGITISVILGTAYACLRIMGSAVGLNLNGVGNGREN